MLQSVPLKLVRGGLTKVMSDLLWETTGAAHHGLLGVTYLGLFVGPYPGFSLDLVTADLTEPTFGGYARVLATWSAQGIDPGGRAEVFSQGVLWNPMDSSHADTVLGIGLYSAATVGTLYGVGLLPTPVELNTPADFATLVARFAIPLDPANWGQSAMVN